MDGLYAQLDQKEKDLTMCAELGNVLLEKNEELRRQNEALEKEFAENVEVRQVQSDKEINLRRPKKCFRQGRHALNKRPHFEFKCTTAMSAIKQTDRSRSRDRRHLRRKI